MVIMENELVTLNFHPDTQIVHHQVHDYLCGKPFRTCLMKGLDVMKKNRATKWLSDERKNAAIPKEDQEWSETIWAPQAFAAGWKYWAIVRPEKIVGKMATKRFAKDPGITNQLVVQLFDDPDDAYQWLADQ